MLNMYNTLHFLCFLFMSICDIVVTQGVLLSLRDLD